MALNMYTPRLAAWLASFILVGAGTAASIAGLRALPPEHPHIGMDAHVHGSIAAVNRDGTFAVQVPGRKDWLWLRPASGARISLAHLRRHLDERAATDVLYEVGPGGALLADDAD